MVMPHHMADTLAGYGGEHSVVYGGEPYAAAPARREGLSVMACGCLRAAAARAGKAAT